MTVVACQQLTPVLGDLAGNAERADTAIRTAISAGAEVIVLPELCTSGYMFASPEEAATVAISAGHDILQGWVSLAREASVVLVAGFCEQGADGRIFNSSLLCPGDEREPVIYRKLHLWDGEKRLFTPGDAFPPVIDTRVGRVATVICYDLEFSELTRALALAGTELLLVPTNWPLVPRPEGERAPEAIIAMAAARANRMAVAVADRCGTERGQAWTQGATIVGADGWVAAESGDPGLLITDIDLSLARDKVLTESAHVFGDRRPEHYGTLLEVPSGGVNPVSAH